MSEKVITVDVRDDIRNGREPFRKIMSTVAQLQPGEQLLVIAPFEPVPLFHVLAKQGFQHRSQKTIAGDWEVLFSRYEGNSPDDTMELPVPNRVAPVETAVTELDARGLEPPVPMVRILETLANLPKFATLRARTDRRPIHLYAELEARGFRGISKEENDGSFVTHICRQ